MGQTIEHIEPAYAYDALTYSFAIVDVQSLSVVFSEAADPQPFTTTTIGSFTRDPIGYVDGHSLYRSYVSLSRIDFSGLLSQEVGDEKQADEPNKVATTLPCKTSNEGCNCEGDGCTFSLDVNSDPFTGRPRSLCLGQTPGEAPENPPPPASRKCTSEINRPGRPEDFFELRLRDGTKCKFTASELPPNAPWPPDWSKLPPSCRGAFPDPGGQTPNPNGPAQGGCYNFTDLVVSIEVDFTLDISCGCDLERTSGSIGIKGKF